MRLFLFLSFTRGGKRCATTSASRSRHQLDLCARRGESLRLAATRRFAHFRSSMGIGKIDAPRGGGTCTSFAVVARTPRHGYKSKSHNKDREGCLQFGSACRHLTGTYGHTAISTDARQGSTTDCARTGVQSKRAGVDDEVFEAGAG